MQKNEYLVVKIGVDTAENEPSKVWIFWLKKLGVKFGIFQRKLPNFRGLVLGCINADFATNCFLQDFSTSTRFAILCTAQISKLQQTLANILLIFECALEC